VAIHLYSRHYGCGRGPKISLSELTEFSSSEQEPLLLAHLSSNQQMILGAEFALRGTYSGLLVILEAGRDFQDSQMPFAWHSIVMWLLGFLKAGFFLLVSLASRAS
jgi:hypothetical protein